MTKLGAPKAHREFGLTLRVLSAVLRDMGHAEESCCLLCESEPIFEALAKNLNTPEAVKNANEVRQLHWKSSAVNAEKNQAPMLKGVN